MAGGMNLATKYAKTVDERWYTESLAVQGMNANFEFSGAQTVKIYSFPTVPINNYARSGSNRYGTPTDLTRNVQTMTVGRDRSFTYVVDKGDKIQSEMLTDAGKQLARELRDAVVPEYDAYCFSKMASVATTNGNTKTDAITKANAYEALLSGQEFLGNNNVPDKGRVAFCSYRFANFLKQDPAFMRYGDMSQSMLQKGIMGEVDGTRIVKVPASRLPMGASFLLVHPMAAVGPRQLEDYYINEHAAGYSGWLTEGRMIYDCFVLDNKIGGVYYHGSQGVLQPLNVITAATASGKSTVILVPGDVESGYSLFYKTGTAPVTVAYDNIVSTEASGAVEGTVYGFTALPSSGTEITPTSTDTVITVVKVKTADMKAKGVGVNKLNIG